jgi:hypothetical protein
MGSTTIKWSELRGRTLGDIYRDAKAGRLRTSLYREVVGWVSLILTMFGMYLALSGD